MLVNAQLNGMSSLWKSQPRPSAESIPANTTNATVAEGDTTVRGDAAGVTQTYAAAATQLRSLATSSPVLASSPSLSAASEMPATTQPPADQTRSRPATAPVSLPDARPPGPAEGTAAERRLFGIPEALDTNLGGPPALPSHGVTKADIDPATGAPRLGELPGSHADANGHNYSVRNVLPPGLTKAQATEAFERFNAPTHEALLGIGNDPSQRDGSIDPSVLAPAFLRGHLFGSHLGGEVKLTHGTTPEGMPWAINSTKLLHPFTGHITRTLEEYDNRFYIRTDGLGHGSDETHGLRNRVNCATGPTSFGRLDELASEYAKKHFLANSAQAAPASTSPAALPETGEAQHVSGAFFAGARSEMHRLAQQLRL
jgi:hypothetical protein